MSHYPTEVFEDMIVCPEVFTQAIKLCYMNPRGKHFNRNRSFCLTVNISAVKWCPKHGELVLSDLQILLCTFTPDNIIDFFLF